MNRWIVPVAMTLVVATGLLFWWRTNGDDPAETLLSAREALADGRFEEAERLALEVAHVPGGDGWAWMVAAEGAARRGAFERAIEHYSQVRDGTSELRASAVLGRGGMRLARMEWTGAEREFLAALAIDPAFFPAARRLADVYNLTGRRDEALPWMTRLLGTSFEGPDDLFHLGDVDHVLQPPPELIEQARILGGEFWAKYAVGMAALAENRPQDALPLLERALTARPDSRHALAGWGLVLLETNDPRLSEWEQRVAQLPEDIAAEGALALESARSRVSERRGDVSDALRRGLVVAAGRPGSRIAWHRAGQLLARAGRPNDAERFLERARVLQRVGLWLDDLFSHRQHGELMQRVALTLFELGRRDEARGWARRASLANGPGQGPQPRWAAAILSPPEARVPPDELVALAKQWARELAPSSPSPATSQVETALVQSGPAMERRESLEPRIRFADVAENTGLVFTHHSGRNDKTTGARIIETTGGGVAVVDFDRDGWPDLYFTQGGLATPEGDGSLSDEALDGSRVVDRLFRNQWGKSWSDVTPRSGLVDAEFGQGVAAGDVNADGFADLYVANYGVNRLWLNQGDGTFVETMIAGVRSERVWTSSVAIADLDGDGLADLFDATYCAGDDVLWRVCERDGAVRSCSPRAFQAANDRVWWNGGDGSWRRVVDGLDLPDGFGLGLVVLRLPDERKPRIFVANDETPNHWLVNRAAPGESPRFEDRAAVEGLAVDADGLSQACMGVACDDADGDGRADLFVTNFIRESNTLYRAVGPGLFVDASREMGVREPSWNMLGFGTQFVDADLDGQPDLMLTNGHIDRVEGEPFEMPPQFLRNTGGRFEEIPPAQIGPDFERPRLGRGLARLDWNRDGREDVVIVHQGSNVALWESRTEQAGQGIAFRFAGTVAERDAIGVRVTVRSGGRVWTKTLTAGDGYQACNERRLAFGVGQATRIDSVEVAWPGGTVQRFGPLDATGEWHVVEGRELPQRAGRRD
jgi:tetratricopeptide (TPR) repeat protein